MTITYSGTLCQLLFRWKGSLWKGVWKQLVVYLIFYYLIRLLYKFALTPAQQTTFEEISLVLEGYLKMFPITFLLGFYISTIVTRWWNQVECIAWPDDLLSMTCHILHDSSQDSRLKRHTVARYVVLTAALAWREISVRVRQRFPTLDHLVSAGLMTEEELGLYNEIEVQNVKWFLPLQWVQTIIRKHLVENDYSPPVAAAFFRELNSYRTLFRHLYVYDWISIPLVYTHVAALATYGYFAICLVGRQFLDPEKALPGSKVDFFIPIFTIVQFLFYIGWFKVGQDIMWPFGTDDDDIELNYILDRHIYVCYTMAERISHQEPALSLWSDPLKTGIPHTRLSAKVKDHPPKLHAYVSLKHPEDTVVEAELENRQRQSPDRQPMLKMSFVKETARKPARHF